MFDSLRKHGKNSNTISAETKAIIKSLANSRKSPARRKSPSKKSSARKSPVKKRSKTPSKKHGGNDLLTQDNGIDAVPSQGGSSSFVDDLKSLAVPFGLLLARQSLDYLNKQKKQKSASGKRRSPKKFRRRSVGGTDDE
jgi:hypothetical protein